MNNSTETTAVSRTTFSARAACAHGSNERSEARSIDGRRAAASGAPRWAGGRTRSVVVDLRARCLRALRPVCSVLCCAWAFGCMSMEPPGGASVEGEPPSTAERALCADADAHAGACGLDSLDLVADCDPVLAEEILSAPCDEEVDPGKADVFADAFCASGLLYWCEIPTCESAPSDAELPAYVGRCEALIELEGCGSCAYYQCRELERGADACGDRGYYEGFVGPYCRRFTQLTYPTLSEAGRRWIDDVRRCLQEAMIDVSSTQACDDVRRTGYDAHPGCYVDTGFCELPIADKWKIFTTVDPRDIGLRQPLATLLRCGGR